MSKKVFRRQIQLSKELDLPFVVHTRDALEDTYAIIKSEGVGPRGGIMHSFSGSLEDAKRFMDLGMMISFSGVVTFKKATDVQEAAAGLPLDKILVQTFRRQPKNYLWTKSWLKQMHPIWHQFLSVAEKIKQPTPVM